MPAAFVGILSEEQGGATDGAHMEAIRGGHDSVAQGGALVAISPGKAQFHEFVGVEQALEFCEHGVAEAGLSDKEHVLCSLANASEFGFLSACEHGRRVKGRAAHGRVKSGTMRRGVGNSLPKSSQGAGFEPRGWRFRGCPARVP